MTVFIDYCLMDHPYCTEINVERQPENIDIDLALDLVQTIGSGKQHTCPLMTYLPMHAIVDSDLKELLYPVGLP